jgi:hypothetical protein
MKVSLSCWFGRGELWFAPAEKVRVFDLPRPPLRFRALPGHGLMESRKPKDLIVFYQKSKGIKSSEKSNHDWFRSGNRKFICKRPSDEQ